MSAYLFDTETTDRKPPLEIIEAAWLKIEPAQDLLGNSFDQIPLPMRLFNEYECRFKPKTPSTFGALAVHHILPSELERCAPSSSFALPTDASYIIGHSVDFDWEAAGSPNVKRICTHAMAQHVWPFASGHSQSALIYMLFGATEETRELLRGAHSAMTDVRLNAKLLTKILESHPEIRTWSALWEFSEECRIPRTCPMKRYEGVPLEELDEGFCQWCLNQDWLDPYFRIGLERVAEKRYSYSSGLTRNYSDDDDELPF